MRLLSTVFLVSLLSLTSVIHAQDANCTAVYSDFSPSVNSNGAYQKCYTDQAYNTALVAQGSNPNYKDILNQVCGKMPACSHSTLISATTKFLNACSASIDAEAGNGNILQTGKISLEIFFAEPIRTVYCGLDPNAIEMPPPAVNPPAYCLANAVVGSPNSRFATNLALYLASGTLRASQSPFFQGLDPADTCSPCSQHALNATVGYLAQNLMPRIAPFYTPEFVQYWSKFVPSYNALCRTSIVQTWPVGTLNETVAFAPVEVPVSAPLPTVASSAPVIPVVQGRPNSSSSLSAGATAMMTSLLLSAWISLA